MKMAYEVEIPKRIVETPSFADKAMFQKKIESLGKFKIRNMEGRSGRAIPNQYVIDLPDGGRAFQSYNSIIAIKRNGQVFLDRNTWDYSRTTAKYRNEFLGEGKAETEEKIKSGEYILADLN